MCARVALPSSLRITLVLLIGIALFPAPCVSILVSAVGQSQNHGQRTPPPRPGKPEGALRAHARRRMRAPPPLYVSRLSSESRTFTGTYGLSYSYNLADALTVLSIPFRSQQIGYNYDNAGRLSGVTASGFTAKYYVSPNEGGDPFDYSSGREIDGIPVSEAG